MSSHRSSLLGSAPRLAGALAMLAFLPGAAPKRAPLEARIDAAVAEYVSDDGAGAVVGVVKDGNVVHMKAYGLADVEEEVPLTVDRNFDLASCSKQFTATCVMILADRGELAFEDDIRTYFPELPRWSAKRAVRIEDLLRMQSGLPEYDDDDPSMASREAMVKWLAGQKLDFRTGSQSVYTNTNYALLGFIVSQVSGQPLARFMHDELFEPLGMTTTVFYGSKDTKIPKRVFGYGEDENGDHVKSVWDVPGTGDGNVFSNVPDLVAWAAAQEAGTLVEAETLERQITPEELDSGEASDYGYGIYVDEYHGATRYSHDGSWYGTSSWYAIHPDLGLTVIVLSNLEETAGYIGEAVADAVLDGGGAGVTAQAGGQPSAARRRAEHRRRH